MNYLYDPLCVFKLKKRRIYYEKLLGVLAAIALLVVIGSAGAFGWSQYKSMESKQQELKSEQKKLDKAEKKKRK